VAPRIARVPSQSPTTTSPSTLLTPWSTTVSASWPPNSARSASTHVGQRVERSRLPLSNRVGEAIGAPHLDTSYLATFGLARVFDGLEVMIDERAAAG
jgi:hypothetical protein